MRKACKAGFLTANLLSLYYDKSFPDGSVGKESACNAGDLGLIPGLERSPGKRNGNPLQYPCLGNPVDRGAWWAILYGIKRVGHDLATTPHIL